jgi:hypothetical protein
MRPSLAVPGPILHKSGMSKIDQPAIRRGEHTAHKPARCFAAMKSLEEPGLPTKTDCYEVHDPGPMVHPTSTPEPG